jgi:hypothetical protein
MANLNWPDGWQVEAIQAALPYVGSEERVDILVGDPIRSHSGTRLSGHLYRGDDGRVMVIYDRSGRPDVHPWAMLSGPVPAIKLRRPRRRAIELYRHPQWKESAGRKRHSG